MRAERNQTTPSQNRGEAKVMITLYIQGENAVVQSIADQVRHYASALPGVRVSG